MLFSNSYLTTLEKGIQCSTYSLPLNIHPAMILLNVESTLVQHHFLGQRYRVKRLQSSYSFLFVLAFQMKQQEQTWNWLYCTYLSVITWSIMKTDLVQVAIQLYVYKRIKQVEISEC